MRATGRRPESRSYPATPADGPSCRRCRRSGPSFATGSTRRSLGTREGELLCNGQVTYSALALFGTRASLGRYLPQAEVVFEYRSSDASIPYQQRLEFRQGFFTALDELWAPINLRNEVQSYEDGLFVRQMPAFTIFVEVNWVRRLAKRLPAGEPIRLRVEAERLYVNRNSEPCSIVSRHPPADIAADIDEQALILQATQNLKPLRLTRADLAAAVAAARPGSRVLASRGQKDDVAHCESMAGIGSGEVDPTWTSLHAPSLVGAAAAGSLPGGSIRVPGG